MTVLLLAEHDNVALSELTARALTAASQMGEAVDILVAGRGVDGVATAAARTSAEFSPTPAVNEMTSTPSSCAR